MSEILIIVPPPWEVVDVDVISGATGYTLDAFVSMQGGQVSDLNDRLDAAGYYQEGDLRIIEVLVLDGKLFVRKE